MRQKVKSQYRIIYLFSWMLVCSAIVGFFIIAGCASKNQKQGFQAPVKIIDLGGIVTEDLPERVWGKATMQAIGFNKANTFEVIEWKFESKDGKVTGSNAYYTLFNHGGPHIDASCHMDLGGGLDSYPIDAFSGPVKVFDVSQYPIGHKVPVKVFKDNVKQGDIVLIYTKYIPPKSDSEIAKSLTLTPEAAEYLATIPIRAFGTDSWTVMSLDDTVKVVSDSEVERMSPIHYSFLSRKIPIYEGLVQVDKLLAFKDMYFVGVPLNIKDGDGMLVRPVVITY